jgi:hypothetical protein
LLVDVFPIGLRGSSSKVITFSMMEGLFNVLEFNLNLFWGLVLRFLTKILYLEVSSLEELEAWVLTYGIGSLRCTIYSHSFFVFTCCWSSTETLGSTNLLSLFE